MSLVLLKVLRGLAPSYLEELVIPYQPNRSLHSQNADLLVVPRVSRSRMGGRAFSYQAPLLWNQLPVQVLRGLAPSYLEELVIPYQPNRSLHSQNADLLVVPRVSRSRMGGRAFSYQAPLLWNQLPVQLGREERRGRGRGEGEGGGRRRGEERRGEERRGEDGHRNTYKNTLFIQRISGAGAHHAAPKAAIRKAGGRSRKTTQESA
ncbi:hypothetical protein D4764_13G0012270 [Takifugu flavidus]|uniref:Uncharacterized protein n=1 Tax=Takifugu flavidus TaxID=433684 RepID=A0A5C6PB20_9TELE|nr:hypothetical protein D4764_13G0012270 [Takifugu flavidus]